MSARKVHYATIKDVAKLANTSTATVSYVLNGSSQRAMSPQLRQRVLDAARELHYTKSAVASSLRAKQRGIVSILIPQFSNIYFTRVCESVEDVVFANDFMPMICDTREDPERERRLIESAIAQRVDGIILGPTSSGWDNTAPLRKMNIPYVAIGRTISSGIKKNEQDSSYFVGDDSYMAGFLAGQCLAQNGHKDIGVIEWNGRVSSSLERDLGFYDAVSHMLSSGSMKVESSDDLSIEEGYRMTKELLQHAKPTALFFGYHRHAQGGIKYLSEIGCAVPDDISVVIVGTPVWASLSNPRYHTVYQHEEWVGNTAGRILMAQLLDGTDPILRDKHHVCPCILQEGGSVKNLNKD